MNNHDENLKAIEELELKKENAGVNRSIKGMEEITAEIKFRAMLKNQNWNYQYLSGHQRREALNLHENILGMCSRNNKFQKIYDEYTEGF